MKRWGVVAGLTWALLAVGTVVGHFKPPGVDSVRGPAANREIVMASGDDFLYPDARQHAKDVWNALNTNTNVDIHPIVGSETHTVKWFSPLEVNEEGGESFSGYWYNDNPDKIKLSQFWFEDWGSERRNAVAAHEIGHALGLEHNSDNTQLMDDQPQEDTPANPLVTQPKRHDKDDYYERWP